MSVESSVDRELIKETNPVKINNIIVSAGKESAANRAIFFAGLHRMTKLKPWEESKGFEVEDGIIDSWYDYKNYLSNRTYVSAQNMEDMVNRIDYSLSIGSEWLTILDGIVKCPMAIDDMMEGEMKGESAKALLEEIVLLPSPSEARKRVQHERGFNFFTPKFIGENEEFLDIEIEERDDTSIVDTWHLLIRTTDNEFPVALKNYVKSKFKIRRKPSGQTDN